MERGAQDDTITERMHSLHFLLKFSLCVFQFSLRAVRPRKKAFSTMQPEVSGLTGGKSFADVVKFGLRSHFVFVQQDDDQSELVENNSEPKQWQALPYNFLLSLCRYLHDRDRFSMAQVCRAWREATLNPSLWRSHVFYLYCRHEVPQGLAWLTGRARFLRHATIMCFGTFDSHRQNFLRALQQTDLLDLDINGAAYWWSAASADGGICGRVVARISRLVKTQRRLHGFQMRQAMLPFKLGMGVLSAALVASGQTLRRLGLEDFFGEQIAFNAPYMPGLFTDLRFENYAKSMKWQPGDYASCPANLLQGEALSVFLSLSPEDISDCQSVKETPLRILAVTRMGLNPNSSLRSLHRTKTLPLISIELPVISIVGLNSLKCQTSIVFPF
ncbi:F-box only protein 39-like [Plakobranchus ocellatus]|uniref:F-box only protein 39-like n=1 Tax=Plakobranchus ocellatus TaxID=259542 RepID=A0AAV3ZSE8_9GAST|nr:F-box only protein 39-like [Plakobranchus ocellatus]